MKPIVITDISQEKFNFLLSKLKQSKEVLVTGNTVEFHGITLQYAYTNGTLTLTPLKKPFMVTSGMIQDIVQDQYADYVEPAKPVAPKVA
jgi:hypothetical protein